MKKALLILIVSLVIVPVVNAADVIISWDPSPGATGYSVYQSIDQGGTWVKKADNVSGVVTVIADVPDSGLVIFKVSALRGPEEAIRDWSGGWFNGTWKPLDTPSSAGIE